MELTSKNAYLQAPISEKYHIIYGLEFGLENIGKIAVIIIALYDGKAADYDYWNHVHEVILGMDSKSYKVDPDVWYKEGTKYNGTTYYQYTLLYTDDIYYIIDKPKEFLE